MSDMYDPMNENNRDNNTEQGSAGESTEYQYKHPEDTQTYSDASYRPDGGYRSVYRQGVPTDPGKPPKKPRRGMSAGAIIAICLVCAIIGGALGVTGGYWLNDRNGEASVISGQVEAEERDDVGKSEEEAPSEAGTAKPEETERVGSVITPVENAPVLVSNTAGSPALSAAQIYDLACRQVVGVTTEITYTNYFGQTSAAAVSGSGFIVSEDGFVLTNYHVIADAFEGGYDISVMFYDGTSYPATIVGTEEDNDVAVLKIDATGLTPVTLGDSDKIQVGDELSAVGNPLGELSYTMTFGRVSALDREISTDASGASINMFQIDAAVNSGNSGGPVYNSAGEVIGIVTAKYSDTGVEGLGFAVPINDAVNIANELMRNGYVSGKAWMGVTVIDVSSSVAQYYNMVVGAYVYSVTPDSAAEDAGLMRGDIITAIDGKPISSKSELTAAVKSYRAGDSAELDVNRSGKEMTIEVVFDEQTPESSAAAQQERDNQQSQENQQSQQGGGNYYFPNW